MSFLGPGLSQAQVWCSLREPQVTRVEQGISFAAPICYPILLCTPSFRRAEQAHSTPQSLSFSWCTPETSKAPPPTSMAAHSCSSPQLPWLSLSVHSAAVRDHITPSSIFVLGIIISPNSFVLSPHSIHVPQGPQS